MPAMFDLGDLFSAVALLIAIVSAMYARASAMAAQASNRVGLHQPRKDIYDGLLKFRGLFVGMDVHPTENDVDAFYTQSVAPAQIYLQPELAQRIHAIYKKSCHFCSMIEIAESGDDPQMSKWDYINPLQKLGRTELEDVIRAVSEKIHLGRT